MPSSPTLNTMNDLLTPISEFDIPSLNIDKAKQNDAIAKRTDWSPLAKGGSTSVIHILKQNTPERMAFRPAPSLIGIVTLMLLISAGLIGVPTYQMIQLHAFQFSIIPLAGFFVGGIGVFLILHFFPPIIFDRCENAFWKGYKSPSQVISKDKLKHYTPFSQIHALQIIKERCETSNNSSSSHTKTPYFSYELNLILEDASRLNITDHGNLSQLRMDAKKLSEFLGKPLWDAVD